MARVATELAPILGTCLFSILTFKYLMGAINKKEYTPIDLKGSVVGDKTSLNDFYGGEDIKEKFRETIDFLQQPDKYK